MKIKEHNLRFKIIGSGYGECILIQIAETYNIVIDCNKDLACINEVNEDLIKAFFGDNRVHFWVITHYHLDHYQAFNYFCKKIQIEQILIPDINLIKDFEILINKETSKSTKSELSAKEASDEFLLLKKSLSENDRITILGSGKTLLFAEHLIDKNGRKAYVSIEVYAMSYNESLDLKAKSLDLLLRKSRKKNAGSIINKTSYITVIKYENYSALLSGDAPISRINKAIKQASITEPNLYKVSHHGSSNSNSEHLITRIQSKKPQKAVITPYNRSHLPTENVKKRLKSKDFEVFITSETKIEERFKEKVKNSIGVKENLKGTNIKFEEIIDVFESVANIQVQENEIFS